MKTLRKKVRAPCKLDDSLLRGFVLETLISLDRTGLIDRALNEFLARHPHYEIHRANLKSECELSCAASATVASCLRAARPAGHDVILLDFEPFLKQHANRAGLERKGSPPLDRNRFARVKSYLEIFIYVYHNSGRIFRESGGAMSGLSTIAYFAAAHSISGNHLNQVMHHQVHHILHELMLPVLISTFHHFQRETKRT